MHTFSNTENHKVILNYTKHIGKYCKFLYFIYYIQIDEAFKITEIFILYKCIIILKSYIKQMDSLNLHGSSMTLIFKQVETHKNNILN